MGERRYEHFLGVIMDRFSEDNFSADVRTNINLAAFGRPATEMHFLNDGQWYGADAATGSQIGYLCDASFANWHNTEFFDVPRSHRDSLYCGPYTGWKDVEALEYLCVPTASVYAYYGIHPIEVGNPKYHVRRAQILNTIALSEFSVMCLACLFFAARDGIWLNTRCPNERLYQSGLEGFPAGRLFSLSPWSNLVRDRNRYGSSPALPSRDEAQQVVTTKIFRSL